MIGVWKTKQAGFTIVELLIVIVVIAILAAITIVAYNGMQQRAKNAAIVATVDGWEKAIRMAAINSEPLPPMQTCLGKASDFPAGDGFGVNECVQVDGNASGVAYSDAAFTGWVQTTRPMGRMPVATYHYGGSTLKGRGIWIFSHDTSTKTIILAWISQIDGACARGNPMTTPLAGAITGGYCGLVINY